MKADYRKELRKKLLKKTFETIDEKLSEKEVHIIKAINLISDLESILNLLKENISTWKERNPSGKSIKELEELEKNSESIANEMKNLGEFIEKDMKEELPTFTELAGHLLGARLLSKAGSKRKLAFIPSSTMQLLGAEKALFNHLKHKADPPKHGLIFNHPLVQKVPKDKRGKAARQLANKLSMAARIDYFSKENN